MKKYQPVKQEKPQPPRPIGPEELEAARAHKPGYRRRMRRANAKRTKKQ